MPWSIKSSGMMSFPFRRGSKNRYVINEPDPSYQVIYLGNVLTIMAKGEGCCDKPLALIWRTHQSRTRPDLHMHLSISRSGLKAETKLQGLTEYWSHRITYCVAPPEYPRVFCWIYKHEGKKMKPELRCHAVLCRKPTEPPQLTMQLVESLTEALREYKREKMSKQNSRLNPICPQGQQCKRKQILSVGTNNFRPPMSRSKSAPKLGMIEEDQEDLEGDEEDEDEDDDEDELRASINSSGYGGGKQISCGGPEGVMEERGSISSADSSDLVKYFHHSTSSNFKSQADDSSYAFEPPSSIQTSSNSASIIPDGDSGGGEGVHSYVYSDYPPSMTTTSTEDGQSLSGASVSSGTGGGEGDSSSGAGSTSASPSLSHGSREDTMERRYQRSSSSRHPPSLSSHRLLYPQKSSGSNSGGTTGSSSRKAGSSTRSSTSRPSNNHRSLQLHGGEIDLELGNDLNDLLPHSSAAFLARHQATAALLRSRGRRGGSGVEADEDDCEDYVEADCHSLASTTSTTADEQFSTTTSTSQGITTTDSHHNNNNNKRLIMPTKGTTARSGGDCRRGWGNPPPIAINSHVPVGGRSGQQQLWRCQNSSGGGGGGGEADSVSDESGYHDYDKNSLEDHQSPAPTPTPAANHQPSGGAGGYCSASSSTTSDSSIVPPSSTSCSNTPSSSLNSSAAHSPVKSTLSNASSSADSSSSSSSTNPIKKYHYGGVSNNNNNLVVVNRPPRRKEKSKQAALLSSSNDPDDPDVIITAL